MTDTMHSVPPRGCASARAHRVLVQVALLAAQLWLGPLLQQGALAQPYAAAGGLGRPALQEAAATAASVAVAASADGTISTVWGGRDGVWRVDEDASGASAPVNVAATDDVRSVSAAYLGGELAITWVTRDRRTGVYHHQARWGGGERQLFEDALVIELRLLELAGEPWAAGLFRRGGEGQVRLVPLRGGADRVVYRTSLTQRGLDVLPLPDGSLWLGWLEGKNERGDFGMISEWDAFAARLTSGPDSQLLGPVALGAANVEDERQRVALLRDPAGDAADVWLLWTEEAGDLRLTPVSAQGDGLAVGADSAPLGRGRPIGGAWPDLYWVEDASIMRYEAEGAGAADAREPESVAWSPITIEGASFAAADTGRPEGPLVALAWFGRVQGGAIQIYQTDDRAPMQLRLSDRLAAMMGWNPWHLWDELLGQLLTALLVGVLGGITLVPVLMAVGPFLVPLFRRPSRALVAGLVLGVLPMVGGGYLYARSLSSQGGDALQGWLLLAAAALFGALVGWLVGRRGDREAQGTLTVAGAMTAFAGFTFWSFVTYKQWAPLVGLS